MLTQPAFAREPEIFSPLLESKKYELEYNFIKKPHGKPRAERVVQDIEVTPENLPEFLHWFFNASDIQPVWLCPIRLADGVESLAGRTEVLDTETSVPEPARPLTRMPERGTEIAEHGGHFSKRDLP